MPKTTASTATADVDTIHHMSDEPTLSQIVPPGTNLGWSDFGYSLVGFMGKPMSISSTPTEEISDGPGIVFVARLHHVATVERQGEEWAFALCFDGGGYLSIPRPGFRGALLGEGGELTVVTDLNTILLSRV